ARRALSILRAAPAAAARAATGKRPFDILAIAVDPRFQGRGLGAAMMEHAGTIALAKGFEVMTLMVNAKNDGALRFYERLGWERAPINGVWRGNMVLWLDGSRRV
ncbi:MAG: GNAT family N-acetyltransferase, partial [Candidatus Baltobacteraceae bacterium]